MPTKTKDGWATQSQIMKQEKAWKRARIALMVKLGEEAMQSVEATKKRSAEIFQDMDADHNGSIDKAELRSAFAAAGVELTMKEVKAMMAEADEDGDGFLDAQEFENLLINEVKRYKSRSKSVFCSLM